MSSNDNISKPFESIPKLSGKENYVTWKQRLTLALILTRSNSFIDPNTKVPADDSLDTWTDRDSQAAAAILSTTSESMLSAHIDHLNDSTTELPRSRVIFKALEKLYATSGPQYSFALGRNSNNNKKKKGKGEQSNETAAPAQVIKTTESSETAAFVSDVVASFDSNSTEHLFLTSDYSHLSLVVRSNRWIIDSGASEHMTGDESLLFDIKALDSTIRIATAGSGTLEAPSIGSTSLLNQRKEKVTLGKVMFVRGLGFNLISVPGLTPLGADVRFKDSLCRVLLNNVEVLRARLQDKAYIVEATQQGVNSFALNKMVLALPASIELSPTALTSKGRAIHRTQGEGRSLRQWRGVH
jgi:hypothetical protein